MKPRKKPFTDFAPNIERRWMAIELRPSNKKIITSNRLKKFQKLLAEACSMHIFCGPMIIAPDSKNSLLPYYTNPKFRPRDWNAYAWWTQPDAANIVSILDNSHTVFYYYPEHNLINISIASCKKFDPIKVIKFISKYWQPDKRGARYVFINPKTPKTSWKLYKEKTDIST